MPVLREGPLSRALWTVLPHTLEIFVLKICLVPKFSFPPASPPRRPGTGNLTWTSPASPFAKFGVLLFVFKQDDYKRGGEEANRWTFISLQTGRNGLDETLAGLERESIALDSDQTRDVRGIPVLNVETPTNSAPWWTQSMGRQAQSSPPGWSELQFPVGCLRIPTARSH